MTATIDFFARGMSVGAGYLIECALRIGD